MKLPLLSFIIFSLFFTMGCQGPVYQSKGDGLVSVRRDTQLTSRRFQRSRESRPVVTYQSDLSGLGENLVLDEALRGRLLNHYERDMEVWTVGPTRKQSREGLFDLGPETENDSLQIFIDLNP